MRTLEAARFVNAVGNHAPNGEVVLCGNADGLESGIVRYEPAAFVVLVAAEFLDGELPIDGGNDDVAIVGLERLVDNNDVAIEQPCVVHAVAGDAGIECGLGVRGEFADKVYPLARTVGSGRRKTCVDFLHKLKKQRLLVGLGKGRNMGHVIVLSQNRIRWVAVS